MKRLLDEMAKPDVTHDQLRLLHVAHWTGGNLTDEQRTDYGEHNACGSIIVAGDTDLALQCYLGGGHGGDHACTFNGPGGQTWEVVWADEGQPVLRRWP